MQHFDCRQSDKNCPSEGLTVSCASSQKMNKKRSRCFSARLLRLKTILCHMNLNNCCAMTPSSFHVVVGIAMAMMPPPRLSSGTIVVFPQNTRLSLPWLNRSSVVLTLIATLPRVLSGLAGHRSAQKRMVFSIAPRDIGTAIRWSGSRPRWSRPTCASSAARKTTMFSWIDGWEDLVDAQTKESKGITLTVSDWFYRGVTEDGGVLAIDPAYFSITGGRERWLYRVARKHAGGNGADGFAISMPTLFHKSGAEGTYRRFKFEILRIVERNDLPGFSLSARSESGGEPLVRMVKREHAEEGAPQEWKPPAKPALPRPRQAPQSEASGSHHLPLLSPLIRTLSERTIIQIRKEFPRWDVYALQDTFNEWIDADVDRTPKNYEAAFYGWVREHHARNRSQVS